MQQRDYAVAWCQRQQPIAIKILTVEDALQPFGKVAVGIVATTSEDSVEL
jgi:hypothetical protein